MTTETNDALPTSLGALLNILKHLEQTGQLHEDAVLQLPDGTPLRGFSVKTDEAAPGGARAVLNF